VVLRFDFWAKRSNFLNFWVERGKTFSKQHFPGFSFTYIMFVQGMCVFISMTVCVVKHVFVCVYRR
jgi:hypothetical protein